MENQHFESTDLIAATLWVNEHKQRLALSWSRRFDLTFTTVKCAINNHLVWIKSHELHFTEQLENYKTANSKDIEPVYLPQMVFFPEGKRASLVQTKPEYISSMLSKVDI